MQVVFYNFQTKQAEIKTIEHGYDLTNTNLVFIDKGLLCRSNCGWCQDAVARIRSRTGY